MQQKTKRTIKDETWYKIKLPKEREAKGEEVIAKGKSGIKWYRERQKRNIRMTKMLDPRICYTSDYDMFNVNWGNNQVYCTIEANLLGDADIRFDVTKNGTIVGIEIENFQEVLKRFDCDKNKEFQKQIRRRSQKWKNTKKSVK
jgi:uncharacterized protein YuzE